MKINYAILTILGFGLFLMSCGGDDDMDGMTSCETAGLTYNNDIASLINSSCAISGCHNAGASSTFPMSDYSETKSAVDFGRIVGSISHLDGFSPMPKSGDKLSDCNIEKITQWIADGAPE